jgi:hypothetical protein
VSKDGFRILGVQVGHESCNWHTACVTGLSSFCFGEMEERMEHRQHMRLWRLLLLQGKDISHARLPLKRIYLSLYGLISQIQQGSKYRICTKEWYSFKSW